MRKFYYTISKAKTVPILLAVLSLASGISLFLALNSVSLAMWPDSAGYLSVARNLAQGKGIIRFDGREQIEQPPLYPAVLAGMSWITNLDPLDCAVFLNATLYSLFVWLVGRFVMVLFEPPSISLLLLMTGAFFLTYPVISVMLYLGSEALFMVLLVWFLFAATTYAIRPSRKAMLSMLITAMLGSLARYAGVSLALAGALVVLMSLRDESVRRRLVKGSAFVLAAVVPLNIFIARNYVVHGTLTGRRGESAFTLSDNLRSMMDTFFSWTLPMGLAGSRPMFILLGIMVAFGLFYPVFEKINAGRSLCRIRELIGSRFMPVFVFGVVYSLFILLAATLSNMDRLGGRLLVPLFIPFAVLAIGAISSFEQVIYRIVPRRCSALSTAVVLLGVMIPQIAASHELLQKFLDRRMTFLSEAWTSSPTMIALRERWGGQEVFSNQPEAVYVITGIEARKIPSKTFYNSTTPATSVRELLGTWPPHGKALIVWFNTYTKSRGFYEPDEIVSFTRKLSSMELSDGKLMEVERLK
jgi:hypothetical protein